MSMPGLNSRAFKVQQAMAGTETYDTDAICPQCRTVMVHVAITPHPVVRNMQRNTYVCYSCKRTRTYMLPGTTTPPVRDDEADTPSVANYQAR
jgi:hypothetical protein